MSVALVTIAGNESKEYLQEYINYYHALGVDRIYLYDNSDDNTLKCFTSNITFVKHFCYNPPQGKSYDNFITEYAKLHEYAMFFDVDEFLCLKKHQNITEFCNEYFCDSQTGAIAVNWKLFGNNNHLLKIKQPVLNRFTKSDITLCNVTKCIVRTSAVLSMKNLHYPVLKKDFLYKDIKGNVLAESFADKIENILDNNIVQLNHYNTKSTEEFIQKCNARCALYKSEKRHTFFDVLPFLNKNYREDKYALNFVNLQSSILKNKKLIILDIEHSHNVFMKQSFKNDINVNLQLEEKTTPLTQINENEFYLIPLRSPVNRFVEAFYKTKCELILKYPFHTDRHIINSFFEKYNDIYQLIETFKNKKNSSDYADIQNFIYKCNTPLKFSLSAFIPLNVVKKLSSNNAYFFIDTDIKNSYINFCKRANIEPNSNLYTNLNLFELNPHADTYCTLNGDETNILKSFLKNDYFTYSLLLNLVKRKF